MSPVKTLRQSAGFTLVEVVVALVVSSLVVTLLFRTLIGQGKHATRQHAQEEVQQNARAAVELISSELRALPNAAITTAETQKLVFRNPKAWGVVCGTASGQPAIAFPGRSFKSNEFGTSADWGVAVRSGPLSGPYTPYSNVSSWTDVSGTPTVCADVERTPVNPPSTDTVAKIWTFSISNSSPARSEAFVYETVTYTVGTSSDLGPAGASWIKRSFGTGSLQPLAGPLRDTQSLKFAYRDLNGALLSPPVTDMSQISAVEITVVTKSSVSGANAAATDSVSMLVHLRN